MISRRSAVALVLPGLVGGWLSPSAALGLIVSTYQRRSFSSLIIDYLVDERVAQVTIKLNLEGEPIGAVVLTPDRAQYTFDNVVGTAEASGTLRLNLQVPPQPSSLDGEFRVRSGGVAPPPFTFKGSVADWPASSMLIFVTRSHWLTSEIEIRTDVLNTARNSAHVSIIFGQTVARDLYIGPDSPIAELDQRLSIGNDQMEQGTHFSLTPPSELQPGQVLMDGKFKTGTTPLTSFSGTVATWPAGTPPQ